MGKLLPLPSKKAGLSCFAVVLSSLPLTEGRGVEASLNDEMMLNE